MKTKRQTFISEWVSYGGQGKFSDFRKMLVKELEDIHPKWTDETLLMEPADCLAYCNHIRSVIGRWVPDNFILRALINARKHPECHTS